jgi:hypothetical protein
MKSKVMPTNSVLGAIEEAREEEDEEDEDRRLEKAPFRTFPMR